MTDTAPAALQQLAKAVEAATDRLRLDVPDRVVVSFLRCRAAILSQQPVPDAPEPCEPHDAYSDISEACLVARWNLGDIAVAKVITEMAERILNEHEPLGTLGAGTTIHRTGEGGYFADAGPLSIDPTSEWALRNAPDDGWPTRAAVRAHYAVRDVSARPASRAHGGHL